MAFKITVLRKMEYKKHLIYVMNFGNVFQYLFSNKAGEIYQDTLTLKPNIIRNIIHFFNPKYPLYTTDELEFGEGVVLNGAIKSIDKINGTTEDVKTINNGQDK